MLGRTARVPKRVAHQSLRCHRPAYFPHSKSISTSRNEVNTSSDRPSQATKAEKWKSSEDAPTLIRTAYIRFWEPIHNIADAWVVKRALEKKYGAILETSFLKDFEARDRYQMVAFIIFRNPESVKRIPEAGELFTVLAPKIPKKPIHEIGVKDIEAYAGNEELQPDFQFFQPDPDSTRRVIGGSIRPSPNEHVTNPEHRRVFQATSQRTMGLFLSWGGFSPVKLDTSRQIRDADLFKPGAREEKARMQTALQICARATSSPIPVGVAPTHTTPEDQITQNQAPSVETARIFAGLYESMPASALGKLRKAQVDQPDEVFVEKSVASTSSATPTPTPKATTPATETKEAKPADSSPSPSSSIPSSLPSPQPIKRPPISPEEKQKLGSQLHAARLLKKAATPVKKKQLKPAVVATPKKPEPWISDSNKDDPLVVEERKEQKGFIAKLAGLFGL